MNQEEWLSGVVERGELSEEARGYLLGRGVLDEFIDRGKFWTWETQDEESPDSALFGKRYGSRGERLNGWLACPLYCPRGDLLGFEGRTFHGEKRIIRYLLHRAFWNPVWIGMPTAMDPIFSGLDPWVLEGVFDVEVMRHILPGEPILGSLRAKVTGKHVEFLKRFVRPGGSVMVVYDNDDTGRRGTKIVEALLNRAGLRCRIVRYIGGKDPGEIWETRGIEGLHRAFRM